MEHMEGPSLWRALGLLPNIRSGWKGLPETNTLAYYKRLQITAVKYLWVRPGAYHRSFTLESTEITHKY